MAKVYTFGTGLNDDTTERDADDSDDSSEDVSSDSEDGSASTLDVLNAALKLGSVLNATSTIEQTVYGDMTKWARSVQVAVKCIKYMISITKSLVRYIRYIKVHDPETTQDKLLAILYQIDNVIIDIPVTISYCIGKKASDDVKFADSVLTTAEYALRDIITNGAAIVSSWSAFTNFMKNITLGGSISSLGDADITSLKSALKSNTTCGYDMKRLLDRTWMTVAELRRLNPEISEDDIRVVMSHSNLVLKDIPIATNNCMNELLAESDELTAYATRDTLRKTFAAIVDDLVSAGTSNNGTLLRFGEYAFKIADRAIGFWSIWDPFYVSSVISEFVQSICGPTQLIGEIDDGNVRKALGMKTVQGAFNNSDGMWTKNGNGIVTINFKSVDTKDSEPAYPRSHLGRNNATYDRIFTHIAKTCPVGYNRKLGTCWAQCPYAYPVQCGMECIRQNDDCALEIVTKVSALAQTTLSFITYDVFGKLSKLARAVQVAIKCAKYTMGLIKALAKYVRNIKVTDPQTPEDKILAMLYQTDNVVVDIPIAVSYCIGSYASDEIKFVDSRILDRTWMTVVEYRKQNPQMSEDDIRVAVILGFSEDMWE
eukprot:jgi/Phyca11/18770/fgenesh1_pg.PHYCAscaffold_40_\